MMNPLPVSRVESNHTREPRVSLEVLWRPERVFPWFLSRVTTNIPQRYPPELQLSQQLLALTAKLGLLTPGPGNRIRGGPTRYGPELETGTAAPRSEIRLPACPRCRYWGR